MIDERTKEESERLESCVQDLALEQITRLMEKQGEGFKGWDDPQAWHLERCLREVGEKIGKAICYMHDPAECQKRIVDAANFLAFAFARVREHEQAREDGK